MGGTKEDTINIEGAEGEIICALSGGPVVYSQLVEFVRT